MSEPHESAHDLHEPEALMPEAFMPEASTPEAASLAEMHQPAETTHPDSPAALTDPVTFSGLVVKEQSGFFWVERDGDGLVFRTRLRGRLLEAAQSADIAAIGDRVTCAITDPLTHEGAIEHVEPRTHAISKAMRTEGSRGAGAAEREHVIIANPDQVLFVFAAAQPDPSPRMLDRFLVIGERAHLDRILIIVNKLDLADEGATRRRFSLYERIGYPVLYTSAVSGAGLDALREALHGRLSAFAGPSGVGKSTLLNTIQPGLARATKAVSDYSQEGVHTTRDSQLIRLAGGGYVADTPGMRSLSIWDVEPSELDGYFPEIGRRVPDCRFADCTHREEPGCAVRAAVERGEIAGSRYKSYRVLRDELEAGYVAL
jgi:ribosome biogenesis GTPase